MKNISFNEKWSLLRGVKSVDFAGAKSSVGVAGVSNDAYDSGNAKAAGGRAAQEKRKKMQRLGQSGKGQLSGRACIIKEGPNKGGVDPDCVSYNPNLVGREKLETPTSVKDPAFKAGVDRLMHGDAGYEDPDLNGRSQGPVSKKRALAIMYAKMGQRKSGGGGSEGGGGGGDSNTLTSRQKAIQKQLGRLGKMDLYNRSKGLNQIRESHNQIQQGKRDADRAISEALRANPYATPEEVIEYLKTHGSGDLTQNLHGDELTHLINDKKHSIDKSNTGRLIRRGIYDQPAVAEFIKKYGDQFKDKDGKPMVPSLQQIDEKVFGGKLDQAMSGQLGKEIMQSIQGKTGNLTPDEINALIQSKGLISGINSMQGSSPSVPSEAVDDLWEEIGKGTMEIQNELQDPDPSNIDKDDYGYILRRIQEEFPGKDENLIKQALRDKLGIVGFRSSRPEKPVDPFAPGAREQANLDKLNTSLDQRSYFNTQANANARANKIHAKQREFEKAKQREIEKNNPDLYAPRNNKNTSASASRGSGGQEAQAQQPQSPEAKPQEAQQPQSPEAKPQEAQQPQSPEAKPQEAQQPPANQGDQGATPEAQTASAPRGRRGRAQKPPAPAPDTPPQSEQATSAPGGGAGAQGSAANRGGSTTTSPEEHEARGQRLVKYASYIDQMMKENPVVARFIKRVPGFAGFMSDLVSHLSYQPSADTTQANPQSTPPPARKPRGKAAANTNPVQTETPAANANPVQTETPAANANPVQTGAPARKPRGKAAANANPAQATPSARKPRGKAAAPAGTQAVTNTPAPATGGAAGGMKKESSNNTSTAASPSKPAQSSLTTETPFYSNDKFYKQEEGSSILPSNGRGGYSGYDDYFNDLHIVRAKQSGMKPSEADIGDHLIGNNKELQKYRVKGTSKYKVPPGEADKVSQAAANVDKYTKLFKPEEIKEYYKEFGILPRDGDKETTSTAASPSDDAISLMTNGNKKADEILKMMQDPEKPLKVTDGDLRYLRDKGLIDPDMHRKMALHTYKRGAISASEYNFSAPYGWSFNEPTHSNVVGGEDANRNLIKIPDGWGTRG